MLLYQLTKQNCYSTRQHEKKRANKVLKPKLTFPFVSIHLETSKANFRNHSIEKQTKRKKNPSKYPKTHTEKCQTFICSM